MYESRYYLEKNLRKLFFCFKILKLLPTRVYGDQVKLRMFLNVQVLFDPPITNLNVVILQFNLGI